MKKLLRLTTAITAATLMTLSPVTVASDDSGEAKKYTCEQFAQVSAVIMEGRQKGMPMVDVMKVATGTPVFEEIIKQAYSVKRFSSDEYQQEAITEFSNMIYRACLESDYEHKG